MPELPEVETTRRGIAPHVVGQIIKDLKVRESRLRWPVEAGLADCIRGRRVLAVERRGKYLIVRFDHGALLIHLGMSGSLRVVDATQAPGRHDHIDILMQSGPCLRFNDPRRFGSFHFAANPEQHPLLANLGPEPLADAFDGAHLAAIARGRRAAIKTLIMNARVVVGVGNIYANEALFMAGIHPARAAGRISAARLESLAAAIRTVLSAAIECGGTTLRDFVGGDGKPGYFRQSLAVYDRAGQPCRHCATPIRRRVLGQRASYFCPTCQR
jgi:formamidopyrimidine-DNA glycosylase